MLFIDSGADSCFMDLTWCQNMGFPLTEISPPHSLVLAGGQSDPSRSIKHRTVAIQVKIGNHYELISFYVCNLGHPVILGFDWLSRHNPDIDWSISNLTFKSEFCLSHCCPTISKPSCSASPFRTTPSSSKTFSPLVQINPPNNARVPSPVHVTLDPEQRPRTPFPSIGPQVATINCHAMNLNLKDPSLEVGFGFIAWDEENCVCKFDPK